MNVCDDAGASRFLRRFPKFLPTENPATPQNLPYQKLIDSVSEHISGTPEMRVRHLQNLLMHVWWGNALGASILFVFLMIDDLNEAIRIAELFMAYGPEEQGKPDLLEKFSLLPLLNVSRHLRPYWLRQGQFKYTANTALQRALYVIWGKSAHAKVCRNPDCPASFFIAKKVWQQYCGDECAAPARLEAKNKYWRTTGKKRRALERRRAPTKRTKR
jgi:hypothetical protein